MEKICFYNTVHIGDTFFNEPFIRIFCENNSGHTFYVWLLYGYYLYNDINNLTLLDKCSKAYTKKMSSGEPPEDNTVFDIQLKNMFIKNHVTPYFKFKYNNEIYIAINTHCMALGCNTDMCPIQLNAAFYNVINVINQIQSTQFMNKKISNTELFPKLPIIDELTKFDAWAALNTKKTCFFFNYKPRSLHYTVNYNDLVRDLARSYIDYVFIVPRFEPSLAGIANIKFCDDDFDCIETPDCKNLVMIEQITRSCDIIITLPTGASWLWFNRDILSQTSKKYILSGAKYEKKLNDWFSYGFSSDTKVINNIEPNNIKKIFE